jgi:integrase
MLFRQEFGDRPADSISKQELVRFLLDLADEREWAPASYNRWQSSLSLVFRVGIENEKIPINPASRIKRRTEENGRIRFLSDAEEKTLVLYIQKHYPEQLAAFLVSVHTGMRAGEQFRMQWQDVDFSRCILTIPKTKNGDIRYVPLNDTAIAALKSLHGKTSKSPWVFLNTLGEKLRNHRD